MLNLRSISIIQVTVSAVHESFHVEVLVSFERYLNDLMYLRDFNYKFLLTIETVNVSETTQVLLCVHSFYYRYNSLLFNFPTVSFVCFHILVWRGKRKGQY